MTARGKSTPRNRESFGQFPLPGWDLQQDRDVLTNFRHHKRRGKGPLERCVILKASNKVLTLEGRCA